MKEVSPITFCDYECANGLRGSANFEIVTIYFYAIGVYFST